MKRTKFFTNFIIKFKKSDIIFDEKDEEIPFRAPFIDQKKDIDRSSTLYSINAPFELFHADIRFLSKSAVDPHYCLLYVGLFSSEIYTYPIKKEAY